MKDLFKQAGFKYTGWGGIKCPCCDNGMSKKRKTKVARNLYSKLRRTHLKQQLIKKLQNEES